MRPYQRAKPHSRRFAESDMMRQQHVCGEVNIKNLHLSALVFVKIGVKTLNIHHHGLRRFVAKLAHKQHNLVYDKVLQKQAACIYRLQALIARVILLIERVPVPQLIALRCGDYFGRGFVQFEVADAEANAFARVQRERPVGLRKKVLQRIYALVEAHEQQRVVVQAVLYARVAVQKRDRRVVRVIVIVKFVVFQTRFFGNRAA